MDNFLTMLYFEKFSITQKETRLRENNTWPESEDGRRACVRNDQSISETMEQGKMIDKIIEKYLEKLKQQ